ncbi:hypothetical protein ACIQYL_20375 [Lysinibacillus xylanilyticus]|uniref:hypothetical protein n=1 Tax=Lysinibacillus xylanilyticus TaxID=582475 RepID=UPI0037FF25B8
MYKYQIELLKERFNGLNSTGQEYAVLAIKNAPIFLNVPVPILKNRIRNTLFLMILLILPLLAVSFFQTESMVLKGFLFALTVTPSLIMCTLNLARWSTWESLKDEVNARTFNFEKLIANACDSRKILFISYIISTILTAILSTIMVLFEQDITLALMFIVPYLAFCLYKGTLTKIRTTYLLHVSSDIARFKGDFNGQ